MSKTAKPFWSASKTAYYVRHRGRLVSLGPDKAKADRRWRELEAGAPAPLPNSCKTVAQLAVAFDGHAVDRSPLVTKLCGLWSSSKQRRNLIG